MMFGDVHIFTLRVNQFASVTSKNEIQQTTNQKNSTICIQFFFFFFDNFTSSFMFEGISNCIRKTNVQIRFNPINVSIANKFYNIDMKLAQSQATRALETKLVLI